jgi:prepilin-type N-terminal cleavage/methylation domain-containing protein
MRKRNLLPLRGFTLVEMLVVLAVIGMLVALLLPAVQQCRESARRMQCGSNLTQLIVAVNHYQTTHRVYPPGTIDAKGPILNARLGFHHGWVVQVLPYLESQNAWNKVHHDLSIYHPKNKLVNKSYLSVVLCPSSTSGAPASDYAGCHHDAESPIDIDNNGVFFLNSRLGPRDIKDGTSSPIFLGEKIFDSWDMEWSSGTRGTLRNTGSTINKLTLRNGGLTGVTPGSAYGGPQGPPGAKLDPLDVPGLESDKKPVEPSAGIPGVTVPATGSAKAVATLGMPTFVGGFGSAHPGGAMFAFGDGSIKYLHQTLDGAVLRRLGHRADGKLPPEL